MPSEVRERVRQLCDEIFCMKMPLPTEVVIMDGGGVRLEWSKGLGAPVDTQINVYKSNFAIALDTEPLPKFIEDARQVCNLLRELFAGKYDESLYGNRDEEIERIRSV